jgi:hypothetical protein
MSFHIFTHKEVKALRKLVLRFCPNLGKTYFVIMTVIIVLTLMTIPVFAVEDMWTVATRIIKDIYTKLAGISTVLAGLMSAVAVIGAKLSNNQQKNDQAWDWLKRIWASWAIINGIGAFLAYIVPMFEGLATLDV